MRVNAALSGAVLHFASLVYAQTYADVVNTNFALTSQADTVDFPVVALKPDTSPTEAQKIPGALQSLSNAVTAARDPSKYPAAPTTDTAVETNLVRSWGYFANTVQELMVDYVYQKDNLINVFGLKASIYQQVINFNQTFQPYAAIMVGLVGDQQFKNEVLDNTKYATGRPNVDITGILQAAQNFAP